MIEKIVVEWNFEPKDYFEADFAIEYDNYSVEIKSGIAKAVLDTVSQDKAEEIISDLTRDLVSCFLAIQVMNHQSYKLGKPSRYDLRKDGTKNIYLQIEDIVQVSDISPLDIIVNDKNGNVISDSKQDRINEKKWFSNTSAKYRLKDPTLDRMLNSYNSSVYDQNNELVHLYEIRDAVSKKFGSEKKAKAKLKITKEEWSDFGLIANSKPLFQGRHRGKNADFLRNADVSELGIMRKIASKMVKNYMNYLENTN